MWLIIDDGFEDNAKVEPLSDAAHRLWFRAACWCKKPRNAHTNGFVPRALLPHIAKRMASPARLEALAAELVDAKAGGTKEFGLWIPVEGGWQFHDWHEYQNRNGATPPATPVPPATPAAKAEAGRIGGIRSAEARAARYGTAQPSKQEPEAPLEASSKHAPKHAPKQSSKHAPKHAEAPDPDPDPKSESKPAKDLTRSARAAGASTEASEPSLTPIARSKGERPSVRAGLLPTKVKARDWEIPGPVLRDLADYALELGLSSLQFEDVLADVREKIVRPAEPTWLHSQVCRFIEQRAERLRQKTQQARAVGGELPRERDVDREGDVCELGEDEKPRLAPPLRFRSWDIDPTTRRFTSGRDSEGATWYLDDERRLRRRAPPPAAEPASGTHKTAAPSNGRGHEGAA